MPTTRRTLLQMAAASLFAPRLAFGATERRALRLILTPTNLGLRPLTPGHPPGAWRAPTALMAAGLAERLRTQAIDKLPRPDYRFDKQPGTWVRNGNALREHGLKLGEHVDAALKRRELPIVIGGDCSVLLGAMYGARQGGRCGLVHVDGHNDFYHPGNYDAKHVLGSAAGMDLALATGRGEKLLTHWPNAGERLAEDADSYQVGDREAEGDEHWIEGAIARITAQQALREGTDKVLDRLNAHFNKRALHRVWLHVDLDVLDQDVMPAVDSPGSPGFDYGFLSRLLRGLVTQDRVLGLNVTIYDPELDPKGDYARGIVGCLADAFVDYRDASGA